MPSISGICTSITTTCGASRSTAPSASTPVAAVPTTATSSMLASSAANPSRKTGWSSTTRTPIGSWVIESAFRPGPGECGSGECRGQRELGVDLRAGRVAGGHLAPPAQLGGPLPQGDQADPGAGAGRDADAVVEHLDHEARPRRLPERSGPCSASRGRAGPRWSAPRRRSGRPRPPRPRAARRGRRAPRPAR